MKHIQKLICVLSVFLSAFVMSGCAEQTKKARIGIIGAMDEEVATLKDALTDKKTTVIGGVEYCTGKLEGKDVVIVRCGVGKVNAGICTEHLINDFHADRVINTGVAGSLDADIDIGDIVVSTDVVQHDFDVTPLGFEPGELYDLQMVGIPADEKLRRNAVNAVTEAAPDVHVFEGRVLTGDQFIASKEKKNSLIENFGGMCCEMEGGAIAQVCCQNSVPFVIIRAISDKADDSEEVSYNIFMEDAAEHCAAITRYMVAHIDES